MHTISIDATPRQLSKLRKGLPVRIKKGEGFNLIVSPTTYHRVSRTFAKDKGTELTLTPEELTANQTTEMEGQGIFGKKFDKTLKKLGIKKSAYAVGDTLKPAAKAAILSALTAGGTALGATSLFASGGAAAPLAPLIPVGVAGTYALASDYLDNPSKYQQSGLKSKAAKTYEDELKKAQAAGAINSELGTNYNYMGQAGIGSYLQNAGQAGMNTEQMSQRQDSEPISGYMTGFGFGPPPSRGSGEGLRRHMIHERGSIGRGAGMIQYKHFTPPALLSQPHGANLQMSHFLPPQYQQYFNPMLDHSFNDSIGSGLYAGRGLYGSGLY